MIAIYFYGDKQDDGTRELLEIYQFYKAKKFTHRHYKSVLLNLDCLRDFYTEGKYVKAMVFNGDKYAFCIESFSLQFGDETIVYYSINGDIRRHYQVR